VKSCNNKVLKIVEKFSKSCLVCVRTAWRSVRD